MESYELKDTDENIKDTLLHDSISRNLYLYRFIDMLDTIDGSVSIAINGRWGTGKTFFAKQAKLAVLKIVFPLLKKTSSDVETAIESEAKSSPTSDTKHI